MVILQKKNLNWENFYMLINIYEYTENMPSLNMSLKSMSNEL